LSIRICTSSTTDGLSYPWVGNYRQLSGNYLYETYSAQALSLGIARTLLMEVDVPVEQIEDEAQMAEDLRRELGPPMVGAVISCRPEDPEFPAFLDRQLRRPHIRGLRRVLHVAPDDISRAYLFRENLQRLAASGLPFDVCVFARQLGLAAELAAACPNTRFVFDHCGHPEIASGTWEPWRAAIVDLARRPNLAVKISGLPAYAGSLDWTADALRPYVEHCIAAFGWNRVVWGSDWPICLAGGPLSHWVEATRSIIATCSEHERSALMEGNAARIYRL
jgi:predicted TIM-barrel fold metal-dependent hydrolase